MSTQILIKRSSTAGSAPTTSDIATGELAVNTVDKRIFTNNSGTIVELGTYPSSQAVQGNATVGGTLGVTGATTLSSGSAATWTVTGTLTVPTPSNSTDAASKGYVDAQVSSVIDSAPSALNTLNELAAALNDDANFATTVTNALATKLALAGGTMTGNIVMGANSITSTATPATADTLTRKGYVDGLYQSTVDAEVSAAAAAASATAAAGSASSASTSATTATTQASAASTSATSAASSATAAASSATSSANSATASATSATQSAASATQAQALVDSIESFYLGAEASAPTVDDNGDPLQAGDWYFNTTDSQTYIYNGSSWQSVSPDLVSDLTPQLGGNLDTNGNDVLFGDNDKAIFGAGSDLQIYHNGSNSIITETGTGHLYLGGDNLLLANGALSSAYLEAISGGAVNIYHNGSSKLATTSTGIDVTGTATMDGLTVDGGADTTVLASLSGASNLRSLEFSSYAVGAYAGAGHTLNSKSSHGELQLQTGAVNRFKIHDGGDISFYEDTGTTAKFFWDASAESLGIGTSSPSAKLVTQGASATGGENLFSISKGSYGDTAFYQYYTSSADYGLNFGLGVSASTGGRSAIALASNSSGSGTIKFTTSASERMRIDSSGNLLVGTTSNNPTNGYELVRGNPTGTYHINATSTSIAWNHYAFKIGANTVGTITTSGSSTAYNTSSDYRLKEDWQPVANASDRVAQLKPVNFAWKIDGSRVDGFLAHELAEVIPEAVTGTKDAMRTEEYEVSPAVLDEEGNVVTEAVMGTREVPDYQGIDQSKLVPLLTAALQEALTEIDNLKQRVSALETN